MQTEEKDFQFEFQLSQFLAHSLVFFTREVEDPYGFNFLNEDPAAQGGDLALKDVNQATAAQLPRYIQSASGQILPLEQARFNASAALSPQELALYQSLVPGYAQLGADITAANRSIDPAFTAARDATLGGVNNLIAAYNPGGGLSPGESSAVSRQVAQLSGAAGNLDRPSAITAIGNALNFGDRYQAKLAGLNQALNTANSVLQGTAPRLDANAAAGATSTGFGNANSVGDRTLASQAGIFGAGTQLKSQEAQINSQRRDWMDRVNEGVSALGNLT